MHGHLPFSLFDVILTVFVLSGGLIGRRNGLSIELPSTLTFLLILSGCALLYEPLGTILDRAAPSLGPLSSFVLAYAGVAAVLLFAGSRFGSPLRNRLLERRSFRGGESVFGAVLGILRFASIAILALALLNARVYTPPEWARPSPATEEADGAVAPPTLYLFQATIFQRSVTGQWIARNLPFLLIKPTPAYEPGAGTAALAKIENLPFNLFDFALLVLAGFGLARAKVTCLSSETLKTLKWVAALLVAGLGYAQVARFFRESIPGLDWLGCCASAYATLAVAVLILFGVFEGGFSRAAGFLEPKLASFLSGHAEEYMARTIKVFRIGCIGLLPLALLNARLYTTEEVNAMNRSQIEAFGNHLFPTLFTFQATIFQNSMSGRWIKSKLPVVLINPTPASGQVR